MKKELDLLLDCPICNTKYDSSSIKIVSGRSNALLVHVNCRNCLSNSLALVSKNPSGNTAVSMGMLIDLDYDEACEILEQTPITADEVLDMHQILDSQKSL